MNILSHQSFIYLINLSFQSSIKLQKLAFRKCTGQDMRPFKRPTTPNGPCPTVQSVSAFFGVRKFDFTLTPLLRPSNYFTFWNKCHYRVSETWGPCESLAVSSQSVRTECFGLGGHVGLAIWRWLCDHLHLLSALAAGVDHLLRTLLLLPFLMRGHVGGWILLSRCWTMNVVDISWSASFF